LDYLRRLTRKERLSFERRGRSYYTQKECHLEHTFLAYLDPEESRAFTTLSLKKEKAIPGLFLMEGPDQPRDRIR